VWLYTECGIVEIPHLEFDRWWRGDSTSVAPHVLDVYDGARPARTPFGAAAASADGTLWFANGEQLQMIDALAARPRNLVAPPVYIEDVTADRRNYPVLNGLALPALTRDLEIDFTALSFRAPHKARFKYRLDGRDVDWQDTSSRRQAVYTDLRPGAYRFRVIASNEDGVWNESGAQLAFTIAPSWYQTTVTKCVATGGTVALAWLLYRRRVRQATAAIAARFDERLVERTRIAQDLHDTFLQTLQGSKLVIDGALDPSTDAERMRCVLERLSVWIGEAMHQGRAALNSLRGSIVRTNNLAESLRLVASSVVRHSSTAVRVSVHGDAGDLHPIVRDEVYAIASEAIRNALLHSNAGEVTATIAYARDLTVRVVDNGVGIGPAMLASGKDGHFGLKGTRKRAARIGARLSISAPAGGGTDVTLVVPGSVIFGERPRRS